MLKAGATTQAAAKHFGVTKNIVAGIWARHGNPGTKGPEPTTLPQRLDALHKTLDRVLAETVGVGKIPEPEREPRR